jgi:hypothetical protein
MAEHIIDVKNSPLKTLENKVDECDAHIGVFHKKWGYVSQIDNPRRLSIAAIEYERAAIRKIPMLVLISNYEKERELEDFIVEISATEKDVWRLKYEDSNDLILHVARGIPHLVEAINSKVGSSGSGPSSPVYSTGRGSGCP